MRMNNSPNPNPPIGQIITIRQWPVGLLNPTSELRLFSPKLAEFNTPLDSVICDSEACKGYQLFVDIRDNRT